MNEARYAIWGSAGHAKVLASLIALHGGRVVALFDNTEVESALLGVPVFYGREGFVQWAEATDDLASVNGLVAIGGHHGRDRIAIQDLFREHRLRLAPLLHPSAAVCRTARLGEGAQVLAQAVVAADAQLGEACIVNHRASIDHECEIGPGAHLAPGATLCGCVKLGVNVMIGAGAVVLPRLTIADDVLIGAGAVVTKNVPAGSVVVGNPGRIL